MFQPLHRDHVRQGHGGYEEHSVGNLPGSDSNCSEPDAREDEDVVRLSHNVSAPADLDRVEGAPGCHDRPAIAPREHVGGRGFGVGGRVGKWENYGLWCSRCHLSHCSLAKDAGRAARTYQDRGRNVADDGLEVVAIARFEAEAAQLVTCQREGPLVVLHFVAPFEEETLRIEHCHRVTRLLLGGALRANDGLDEPGYADTGSA